jgi:fructokinase
MAEVVCLGELLIDMVSDADASLQDAPRFLKAPGGAPANVAVGLARLGTSAAFVGKVGNDPFGEFLSTTLEREGVDVSHLLKSEQARTTIAFVATRSDGRKDICFYRNPGADALLDTSDIGTSLFAETRIFHCGSVSLSQSPCREAQLHTAQMARERGLLVSFDPNWRPSLWSDHEQARELIQQMFPLSDIVKIADEEWEFVTGTTDFGQGAQQIRALGPRLVVITKGADGAYFNCEGAEGHVEGFRANALDTLGAGDAFVAGMLHQVAHNRVLDSLLNADALRDVLRFANACGAIATQKAGAIPSLPTQAEAESFLRTNN